MTTEDYVWREHVVQRLRQRDRKECQNFKEIIVQSEICKITLAQHIYDCACDRSFVIADTLSFLLIIIYCLLSTSPTQTIVSLIMLHNLSRTTLSFRWRTSNYAIQCQQVAPDLMSP